MRKFLFLMLIPTMVAAQQTINGLNIKGKLDVISTTKSSNPCPNMTEAQRDLIIVPATGSCVYNTSALSLNIYDGAEWKSAGGGGISLWLTLTNYKIDDVVIDSNKIYKSLSDHTSGVFATDLANGEWAEVSAQQDLTGEVTTIGSAATVDNAAVIAKTLTGFASAAGTMSSSDSILQALQKADGNTALKLGNTQSNVDVAPVVTTQLNAPASQLTTVDTNTRLLETGNTNLLANPGFEAASAPACTLGSTSVSTKALNPNSVFPGGKQSLKVTSIGAGIRCTFSIPSGTAPMLKGQQMFLRARINSSDPLLTVCSVENGVDNNCKYVAVTSANRLWDIVEIPFIADGTSNGLVVKSATTTTQNIYVDDLVISTGLPNLVGLAGDTVYSAGFSATGVISDINKSGWITFSSLIDTSFYTYTLSGFTSTPVCSVSVLDDSTTTLGTFARLEALSSTQISVRTFYTTSGLGKNPFRHKIICQKSGSDYANASSSAYLSTNGNYSRRPYTPTFQGITSVAPECYEGRTGDYLDIDCSILVASSSASELRIGLPSGLTSANGTAIFMKGYLTTSESSSATANHILLEPNVAYLNIGSRPVSGTSAFSKLTGSAYISGGSRLSFSVRIPIQGWTNSNLIVGSFAGYSNYVSFAANISTTAATNTTPFIFTSKNHDTHNAYSTATGEFTAPVSGSYFFTAGVDVASGNVTIVLERNNSAFAVGSTSGVSGSPAIVSGTRYLVQGEKVRIRPTTSVTATGTFFTTYFSGFKVGN